MDKITPTTSDSSDKLSSNSRHFRSRSAARLAAVQALYQIQQSEAGVHKVMEEFIQHRLGKKSDEDFSFPADKSYFMELLQGASLHLEELDRHIEESLSSGWALDRLESVVLAILRIGAYELKEMLHIPAPIILNEYIDITHAFFEGKEPAFVNGVLHRLIPYFRPQENEKTPHEML